MITGLRQETFENLQLDAGVFLKNVDISSVESADEMQTLLAEAMQDETKVIGATRGNGNFYATPKLRGVEANGARDPWVGSTRNDGWTVTMTGNMLEVTPENFKTALMSADLDEVSSGVKRIRLRTSVKDTDYIDSFLWVGDTSKGFVAIEMKNALNTNGASFTFGDRNENVIPFRFQAHADNLSDMEYAPCVVYFFE